ncbi:MAG: hypothetical protein WC717_05585 [Candidatus Micrarchaeia archaeon]|jgi:hypothetical protein
MNRFAVLLPEFERLSYPLGKGNAADGHSFEDRDERFTLGRAESEQHAQIALTASDWVASHSSEPVGYVCDGQGGIFVVCRTSGKKGSQLARDERAAFPLALVKRLAALHTEGFGCGGLSPDAVEFFGSEAKILNPSRIFALDEGETTFYEAVSTLRSLVSSGAAQEEDLPRLASAYLSYSPVCRHEVVQHLQKKGRRMPPREALVDAAMRIIPYF